MTGTAGNDAFTSSVDNEMIRGGNGAGVFTVAMHGGHDMIGGCGGAWTDETRPTGAPESGNWTVVTVPGVQVHQGEYTLDFSQPASGHIQFADAGQLELSQIERIVW